MDNLTTIIISLTALVTAIGGLIVAFKKTKKELVESIPKRIKKQTDIDTEIVKRMEQVKEIVGADRVQIYDFHNGIHYANGRSALKVSCSYEVCRVGCKPSQMLLQGIPISCIPQFIKNIINAGEMKTNNLEEIKNTMPSTYELKKSQNVKSFYDIILSNKAGEPIGFLAIQFTKTNMVEFTETKKNEILRLKFFIEENLEKMVEKKNGGK